LELARHGSLDAETVRFLLAYGAESPEEIRELALRGPREITLVEMARKPARDVGKSTRWVLLRDLKQAGVKVMTDTVVKRVIPNGVEVERGAARKSGKQNGDAQTGVQLIECDTAVLAAGVTPNRELEAALQGLGIEVKQAGDVVEPARALEAVRAGFEAGISI
jgi:2,4-dienoyl-CoA reductase (NADPH2)